ncbi:MAG: glycosyltransferase family 2 protein [Chitinophagaceae bacterium]|jgi:glycosyltransferase involved in cell wall biosynthesis|nr:glycosyltransferase family 2 protein [Chitinophagaceae bacterium]MBK7680840.1 glycosyltransferase family 2 protein [Chitinophagaceae bacterium]MBK8300913.1 glycosyltransferase family 2 protein [Chitinophagaceae bacterium]MBK9465255.1 glycosyltransferase family 2 protein [Chitinophagaceae bacterium]MBK9660399.1 glycosyltransferase family 2 protein [Chitinophagaceae bacterium]
MKAFSSSLVISTYNRPDMLRICFQGVLAQSVQPDEIIIADDGSGPATKQLVEEFTAKSPVPVLHVWQPDEGFQLAAIRNKSFAKASGDYIIQTDGDIILHKHFVKDHIRMAEKNTFISGARSLLDDGYSKAMIQKMEYSQPSFFSTHLGKRFNAFRNILLMYFNYFIQRGSKQYRYVLGANMAFWKSDLVKVNGYNEEFKGWGKEDNDLAARLCNAGIKLRFIKFGAVTFHLYHTEATRGNLTTNENLLQQTVDNKITFVSTGISSHY